MSFLISVLIIIISINSEIKLISLWESAWYHVEIILAKIRHDVIYAWRTQALSQNIHPVFLEIIVLHSVFSFFRSWIKYEVYNATITNQLCLFQCVFQEHVQNAFKLRQLSRIVPVGSGDYNLETDVRLAPKLPFSRAIAIQAGSTGWYNATPRNDYVSEDFVMNATMKPRLRMISTVLRGDGKCARGYNWCSSTCR